jgi:hypothetical protein
MSLADSPVVAQGRREVRARLDFGDERAQVTGLLQENLDGRDLEADRSDRLLEDDPITEVGRRLRFTKGDVSRNRLRRQREEQADREEDRGQPARPVGPR